jgi:NodT family efflux transporter outer membrane factor (OMF) lipoprotein
MNRVFEGEEMKRSYGSMRRAWRLCLGAAPLLLAGCTVGPKYVRPTAPPPPPAYKNTEPASNSAPGVDWTKALPDDAAKRGAWWVIFNDKTLSDLEEKATAANLNIKAAEASFRQAHALVRQAEAGYYPTVQVQPSATMQRIPLSNLGIPGLNSEDRNQFKLQGTVAWEPDLWGRVRKQVESDVEAAQVSAADIANTQLDIQAEVASDYVQACGLDEEDALYQQTVADDQRTLDLTREQLQYGTASQVDVKQAEAQLDVIVTQERDLAVQRSQYEDAIAVLIGVPAPSFTLRRCGNAEAPPPIPAGIPSKLLQRRPDVAAAERQVAEANAQIGLAKSAYYPSLSINAGGGYSSDHVSNLVDWPSRVWSLGSSATQLLFDGGSRKAQVEQAKASYDSMVANYRNAVITAFQEVQDNLAATQVLASEALTQGNAVAASQVSVTLTTDRLQHGTASAIDLANAQNTLLTNEQAALSIRTRQMNTAVQLIKALGGGWQEAQLPSAKQLH